MDRSRIGIVIPALNEERSIGNVVRQCCEVGVPIVVDDGSTDNTAEVSKHAGAEVITHSVNRGYDGALNSGFSRAALLGCEYIITIDADGQHNPEVLSRVIKLLDNGADVVIGIRNMQQRFAEHCFAFVTRGLYGVSDPLCGLNGYRLSVYLALGYFDSYDSIGTELALFAVRRGYTIEQIPISIQDRDGLPRFGRRFYANYKIFRAMVWSFIKA
ncbi:MAG: glycosyltransferase family 2 protein [Betaproteobacteria bacterium]